MTARFYVRLCCVDGYLLKCTSDIAIALYVGWFGVRDDCRVVSFKIKGLWSWWIVLRSALRISFFETILNEKYR
jgi:hypothetical protein